MTHSGWLTCFWIKSLSHFNHSWWLSLVLIDSSYWDISDGSSDVIIKVLICLQVRFFSFFPFLSLLSIPWNLCQPILTISLEVVSKNDFLQNYYSQSQYLPDYVISPNFFQIVLFYQFLNKKTVLISKNILQEIGIEFC